MMTAKTWTGLLLAGVLCASALPASAQRYYGHGGYGYDDGAGAAVAGGILGFTAGAIAAGAANDAARRSDPSFIAYCARKSPTFDPQTGAYLASDHRWYPCQ